MRRIPEVFDCWFESGSMPYAEHHYPFENRELVEQNLPADFIAEGLDQTRGWFYTLTVLSTALFGRPAFKNVIVNGIVLAEDGEKMSKSKRNFPDPNLVLEKLGADALRIYLASSPVVNAKSLRFAEDGVREQVRSVLLPLWNAYSFLTRYADVDGWEPDGQGPVDGRERAGRVGALAAPDAARGRRGADGALRALPGGARRSWSSSTTSPTGTSAAAGAASGAAPRTPTPRTRGTRTGRSTTCS